MNKNLKISKIQFSILLIFPILTTFNTISFNNIIKLAKNDAYIGIIYAFIIGFILLYIFIYILNYKPQLSLPEKNIYLFDKVLGTIINYLILFIISIIGITILYSTSNFIMIHYLKETPRIIILLVMGFIISFNVSHGIETITRTAFIFFIIIIILTTCSTTGLIPKVNINNILPILDHNNIKKTVIAGNNLILNTILPIFTLLIIPKDYIKDNKHINKYIIIFYILSIIQIFLITFLTISILTIQLIKLYNHPEYIILKKLSIFNFIDKIENIVYLKWIFANFTTLFIITYYISNTIKKEDKARKTPIIVTSIIILLPIILFKNNIDFNKFILNNHHYLNIILLLIILIIFISIHIKKLKERHN
ncbi:MAG: GerAB/ArcD/ProY family transporter [Bacilli bacterium]|nr:GerAB/ArcD/ProY family transporter [Bacilli bacterium]